MYDLLLYMLLIIIAFTFYFYFYVSILNDILSGTGSNSAAAGGFGANQVATALGLGMFILGVRLFINSPTIGVKLLNTALLILMSYRAVVTLSRGGVIAGILCIAI